MSVPSSSLRASRRGLVVLAVAGLALGLSACTPTDSGSSGSTGAQGSTTSTSAGGGGASSSSSSTPVAAPTPAEVTVTPANDKAGVRPDTTVKVKATSGTLVSVKVADAKGNTVAGAAADDGTWTSSQRLTPGTTYKVTYTAAGSDGSTSKASTSFSTLKPKVTATYHLVYDGETVGVGMPVSVQFDSAVTKDSYRAEVEKHVSVTTSPKQAGSWGWLDNRQLMWRPAEYWKPGTKVTVKADLNGVQTGDDKWVANSASGGFSVGSATISTVNIATHMMTVTQNGKVLRNVPISAGREDSKPTYVTRSGTKVIISKEPQVVMDSSTSGVPKSDPDYYREVVDLAMRVTWTGEYLHSAPWSVYAQGNANVSHGCVNLSPANAKWMYNLSKVGDVVKFVGSNRQMAPTEGIGVWEYSYAGWKKQSALAGT